MAKAKAKNALVLLRSMITGHKKIAWRERTADKIEMIGYDPYIRKKCVYKEEKRIRSF